MKQEAFQFIEEQFTNLETVKNFETKKEFVSEEKYNTALKLIGIVKSLQSLLLLILPSLVITKKH